MRALVVASALMGVLIVAGVAVLAALLVKRGFGPPEAAGAAVTLAEPAGTRIVAAAGPPEALALVLSGAGPDRVVVMVARRGKVLGRVALAP